MRKNHIDYAKGMGILAVLWGHIMLKGWSYSLVYSFSIPLFFFLSGFVFNSKKYPALGQFFPARWKSLILPYALFSVITWFYWIAYLKIFDFSASKGYWYPLFQTLIAQGSSKFLTHNTPLWFPPCLFVVELGYYMIRSWKPTAKLLLSLLLAAAGYFMIQENAFFDFRLLPYSLEAAASAFVFYTTGHLFKEACGIDPVYPHIKIVQCSCSSAVFCFFFPDGMALSPWVPMIWAKMYLFFISMLSLESLRSCSPPICWRPAWIMAAFRENSLVSSGRTVFTPWLSIFLSNAQSSLPWQKSYKSKPARFSAA